MGNPLTSDFDVAVQLSEELLQRFFILQYFADPRLQMVDQSFDDAGIFVGSASFKILIPSLSLHIERPVGVDTFLRLILPFEGQLEISDFSTASLIGDHFLEGTCAIDVAFTQTRTNGTINASLSFAALQMSDLDVTFDNTGLSAGDEALLGEIFAQGALMALAEIGSISVLNLQTGTDEYDVRSMEVRTLNSSSPTNPTCMILFLMITDDPEPAVNPNIGYFLKYDYSLAVSPKIFNLQKQESLAQQLGVSSLADLPAPLPTDSSTIVRSANLTLGNGHLDFAANITEKITCFPDVDVHVTSTVTFFVGEDGALVPVFASVDADMPWWIGFINGVLPIIGSWLYALFWTITQRMAEDDVGGGTFGDLSIFKKALQLGDVKGFFPLEAKNYGCDISPDGLVIYGNIFLYTYVGNKRSREIHTFMDTVWPDMMNDKYAEYRERWEDYIAGGFNGCYYCLRQLNTG